MEHSLQESSFLDTLKGKYEVLGHEVAEQQCLRVTGREQWWGSPSCVSRKGSGITVGYKILNLRQWQWAVSSSVWVAANSLVYSSMNTDFEKAFSLIETF